jgi:hypothetical protein
MRRVGLLVCDFGLKLQQTRLTDYNIRIESFDSNFDREINFVLKR